MADVTLQTLQEFCLFLMVFLNKKKTELGDEVVFLGLLGSFPRPSSDMAQSISVPPDKKGRWVEAIKSFLRKGAISKDQLGSLVGR